MARVCINHRDDNQRNTGNHYDHHDLILTVADHGNEVETDVFHAKSKVGNLCQM